MLFHHASEDKKSNEKAREKLKKEISKANAQTFRSKSRLDNLLLFCKLIEDCSFSRDEILIKLAEIPNKIISFIKGETDDFTLQPK